MRTTPSIVAFSDDGEAPVGQPAKRRAVTNPEKDDLCGRKRLIGRRYDDPMVEKDRSLSLQDQQGFERRRMGRSRRQQDLFALADIRLHPAEDEGRRRKPYLGQKVEQAVITRSSLFQRCTGVRPPDAGKIAWPKCCALSMSRPRRALAYGLDKQKTGTIAVYALGGGTFDISILEIGDGVFEVKSTNGDTFLGGEDFDMRLVNYLADEFQKEQGIDLRRDKLALQRLKESAEKAKIELSSTTQTEINLPFITADGLVHIDTQAPGASSGLVDDLIQKTMQPASGALGVSGISAAQTNEVVLSRHDAHAEGAGGREAIVRQGAAQGRQPRRSSCRRRRHSGRCSARRREGRPAARRDSAFARH
jgi:molecular chaperone DnaK